MKEWNKELDEKLLSVVGDDKLTNWERVASNFENFSSKDCLKRYRHISGLQNNKGQWNITEDELLRDAIDKLGDTSWLHIASIVTGRNSKQCRERWCNQINPNINHSPFTLEEEELLISKQLELGNKWSKIAKFFKGRPDNMLKNMWHSLCTQRKLKRNNKPRTKKKLININENDTEKELEGIRKKKKNDNKQKMRKTKNNNTISTNNLNDHDKKPKKDDISNYNDKTQFQEMDIKQSNTCPELLNLQPSINEKNKLSFDSNLKLPKSYSNLTNFQEEKAFSQSQTQPQENNKPLSLKEKWISTPIEDEKVSPNQDINLFLDTTETFDQSAMVMQYTLFNPENIEKIYIPPSTEFDQFFEENFDNENDFYDSLSNEDLENSNSEYQNELTDSKEYDFYY